MHDHVPNAANPTDHAPDPTRDTYGGHGSPETTGDITAAMTDTRRRGWALMALLCAAGVLAAVVALVPDPPSASHPAPAVLDPGLRGPEQGPRSSTVPSAIPSNAAADAALKVRLRLPVRLLAGNSQQLHLEVAGPRGRPLDDDLLLEVRSRMELDVRVRGAVWITPRASLVTVGGLRTSPFQLRSSAGIACDTEPGAVLIEVRALDLAGSEGSARAPIPAWSCELLHSPAAPEAPASVHIETPVCGEHWEQDLEELIAGTVPPARWCRPGEQDAESDAADGTPASTAGSPAQTPAGAPGPSPGDSTPEEEATAPDPPDEPAEPDPPEEPAEPDPPDEPTEPEVSEEPEEPAETEDPAEPDEDDQPEEPPEPEEPAQPDEGDQPVEPGGSDEPEETDATGTAENPDEPGTERTAIEESTGTG